MTLPDTARINLTNVLSYSWHGPRSGYDVRYRVKKFARNFARLRNAQKGWTFPKITAPVTVEYHMTRRDKVASFR